MTKQEKIMNRLESDFKLVQDMGYTVLGVFLQGSQNYELDYEGSDIDTKALIVPSINDIVLNKKSVSTTHILESDEHIDIKDVRIMFQTFRKQNINFIEILFTKYKKINPKYKDIWDELINFNEDVAHYNNYASINCMAGMSHEKYKALEHPYPSLIEKIEEYGYDPKQLHHILRLDEFMRRYLKGEKYSDCLISNQAKYLIEVKAGLHSLDEARYLAKQNDTKMNDIKNAYKENNGLKIDKNVEMLLNKSLSRIIKLNFKHELGVNDE